MITLLNRALTGVWLGDDGAIYYVRHHLGRIWWVGLSSESPLGTDEFHPGVRFANVYCGRLIGDTIIGEWADTPRGAVPGNGMMDVLVCSDEEMRIIRQLGDFGCSTWRRAVVPARLDITARSAGFDDAKPEYTRPYAETTVVRGVVVTEPALLGDDITLSVRPDHTLCRLPETSRLPADQALRCRIPGYTGSALPGWKQRYGNSVLFRDGRPINGDVVTASDGSVRILGRRIMSGTEVRLTGFLPARPYHLEHGTETDTSYDTPLLSPVYSFDIVEPVARGTFTGTWTADDHGIYYLRQVGTTLWWLGLSHDQGRSYSNVFSGVITQSGTDTTVSGDLIDVPLGARLDTSRLTLSSPESTTLTTTAGPTRRWSKLSDTIAH